MNSPPPTCRPSTPTQLFFADGIAFDGKQFVRTGVTANAFKYLNPVEPAENKLASVVTTDISTIGSDATISRRLEKWTARAEAIVVGAALVLAAIAYVISGLSG